MAKEQSYTNHIRFYPPHHFVFYPLMLLLIAACVYFSYNDKGNKLIWIFMGLGFVCITWVAFMLRQHYALTLQNRVVLLEMRYRYLAITGNRLEPIEEKLSEGQLFALRFAPDEELEQLVQRALRENLSPDAIKKSVKSWKPDYRRV